MLRRSSGPKWISKLQKSITRKKIMMYIFLFFENFRFFDGHFFYFWEIFFEMFKKF